MSLRISSLVPAFILLLLSLQPGFSPPVSAQPGSASAQDKGKRVYERYCIGCHGERGDGKGAAARLLIVKPRDFTSGTFKFRSTPSGSLPTDDDLLRTITNGLPHTSMPTWILIPENQRRAVIQYLKEFSPRWKEERPESPVVISNPPDFVGTPESIGKGKKVYALMQCAKCHGEGGLGDGPSASELVDDWGNPIRPFNFTRGKLKGGPSPEDIYRTFSTGLDGTPMPSFADSLKEEDRWHLVSYILSLRKKH